jgi:hypothetical protein
MVDVNHSIAWRQDYLLKNPFLQAFLSTIPQANPDASNGNPLGITPYTENY